MCMNIRFHAKKHHLIPDNARDRRSRSVIVHVARLLFALKRKHCTRGPRVRTRFPPVVARAVKSCPVDMLANCHVMTASALPARSQSLRNAAVGIRSSMSLAMLRLRLPTARMNLRSRRRRCWSRMTVRKRFVNAAVVHCEHVGVIVSDDIKMSPTYR